MKDNRIIQAFIMNFTIRKKIRFVKKPQIGSRRAITYFLFSLPKHIRKSVKKILILRDDID